MKIIAVTQARFGSSRLPGKVLMKVQGETLLSIHLKRALRSGKINELIVATTEEPESAEIGRIALEEGCRVFHGSLTDVLDRYYQAVKESKPDYVVRITSDCPLVDGTIIDQVIEDCVAGAYDYCSNTVEPTFPDGMDVEVFTFAALEKAWKEASSLPDREHVTPYIWRNSTLRGRTLFFANSVRHGTDLSSIRLTVDELADLELLTLLISTLGADKKWDVYADYVQRHHELGKINSGLKRNERFT